MNALNTLGRGLAALALLFAAVSCGEPENPDTPTPGKQDPDPTPVPGVTPPSQTLVIKHSGSTFAVPSFDGSVKNAKVQWDDGTEENYSASLTHSYNSVLQHTVTITLDGASAVAFKSLDGLAEIDVTAFR